MEMTPYKLSHTAYGFDSDPYETSLESIEIDEMSRRIKSDLEDRELELPVSQLCTLLELPGTTQPESLWPGHLFGDSNGSTDQEETVRLLNHLCGARAEADGFRSVGEIVFTNAGSEKPLDEKPDIVLLQPPGKMSWGNVLVAGVVNEKKTTGHIQLCKHLLKLHQNRPGGSNYVGFLVTGRTFSVYVSNAAGLLKTLPIDLTVQDSFPLLADCLRIFRHAENLSVPPFEGYLECDQRRHSFHFTSPSLVFVKETMKGSRTAVWSGSLQNDPAILKSCWLPHHLVNHERKLVDLISSQQPWGIIPFAISGFRLMRDGVQQATPHGNQDLILYQEISISLDNGYRAFSRYAKSIQDWITIIAGISDTARILYLVWSKCRVHHCDISTGNIVFASTFDCLNVVKFLSTKDTDISIQPERKPMACLIDWANGRSHSTGRGGKPMETHLEDAKSGTRSFLSIQMLEIASRKTHMGNLERSASLIMEQKYHLPIDDLESLYWVLLWFTAQGHNDELRSWRCADGGIFQKEALIQSEGQLKEYFLETLMGKWDSKSPLTRTIFSLLLDLSKIIKKLKEAFGRLGELENDPTHPDYEADLGKADTKWAPLFSEFVQRLDKTVSELYDEHC